MLEAEAVLQVRSDRHDFRPYGLYGGSPGQPSQNVMNPDIVSGRRSHPWTRLRHFLRLIPLLLATTIPAGTKAAPSNPPRPSTKLGSSNSISEAKCGS